MNTTRLQSLARAIPTKLQTAARSVHRLENWGTYLMDCVGLAGSDKMSYTLRDGTRFVVRAGTVDRYVLNEVVFRRGYFPGELSIGREDTIVEIGGHIGIFSVLAAKMASHGRVYTFEPNPDNFNLLATNLAINRIGNVIARQEAVSDRAGSLTLYIDPGNTGGHSIHRTEQTRSEITVRTTTLTDIVDQNRLRRIDFLKMDCEGAEYEILRRLPIDVLGMIRQIAMECHYQGDGRDSKWIAGLLRRNGFDVVIKTDKYDEKLSMIYAKQVYNN
ncbi:MAG: FkbM family methyltransferase [Candidatus Micrarchaeota archaeon]